MSKRFISCALIAGVFFFCFCQSVPENLQSKVNELDSLIIKGMEAGVQNLDSLYTLRKERANEYIQKLDPLKVEREDASAGARLYLLAGKDDSALAVLEKFKDSLVDRETQSTLFQLYFVKDRIEDAEKIFQTSLKADSDHLDRYYTLLYYGYMNREDRESALRIVDEALKTVEPKKGVYLGIEKSELLFDMGRKSEAIALLKKLKTEFADDEGVIAQIESKWNLIHLVGNTAPPLSIDRWIGGAPTTLKALRGKVVLLDFWAPWCAPCRVISPHIKKLYETYHDQGLEVIGVTRYYGIFNQLGQNLKNIPPEVEFEWLQKYKEQDGTLYPYAVATADAGRKNSQVYGVGGIPHFVLIGKKGKVRLYAIGSGETSEKKLEDGVKELLQES